MEFLDNPAWFLSSDDHHKLSLSKFSVPVLRDAALSTKMQPMAQFKTKAQLIDRLLVAFLNTQNLVMSKSTSDILPLFSTPPSYISRSDLLSKYFSSIFGDIIASALHIPQSFPKTEPTPSFVESFTLEASILLLAWLSRIQQFGTMMASLQDETWFMKASWSLLTWNTVVMVKHLLHYFIPAYYISHNLKSKLLYGD